MRACRQTPNVNSGREAHAGLAICFRRREAVLISAIVYMISYRGYTTPLLASNTNDTSKPAASSIPFDANAPEPNTLEAGIPQADSDMQPNPATTLKSDPIDNNLEVRSFDNMRDLWRASITAQTDQSEEYRVQLDKLIADIHSVKFKQLRATLTTASDDSPSEEAEPNDPPVKPVAVQNVRPKAEETETKPETSPADRLETKTLSIFAKQMQKPQDIIEPFELAEVLYSSGHLSEAAAAYQQALSKMDPKDSATATKRAWTLSQIGNCLRRSNPQEAMKSYRQLIEDYPNSPWTEFAAAMNAVLNWLDQDKPRSLIAEVKQLRADAPNPQQQNHTPTSDGAVAE